MISYCHHWVCYSLMVWILFDTLIAEWRLMYFHIYRNMKVYDSGIFENFHSNSLRFHQVMRYCIQLTPIRQVYNIEAYRRSNMHVQFFWRKIVSMLFFASKCLDVVFCMHSSRWDIFLVNWNLIIVRFQNVRI